MYFVSKFQTQTQSRIIQTKMKKLKVHRALEDKFVFVVHLHMEFVIFV